MLAGDGGNITIQTGPDGVFLVDSGRSAMSGQVLAEIRKLTNRPIRYIADTHLHSDHTGGNEAIGKAGSTISGGDVDDDAANLDKGAAILAHQRVLDRMSVQDGNQPPAPFGALPTDVYRGKQKDLFFNGEPIILLHQPAAHTDGDSLVFFRGSNVISTGDIFVTTSYPEMDLARGGSIQGLIDALNRILELTVPEDFQEGGTLVIPGHGRICDEADVVEYRDMVTIVRDRIADLVKKGHDARPGEGGRADGRLRSALRLECGPVHRSRLSESGRQGMTAKALVLLPVLSANLPAQGRGAPAPPEERTGHRADRPDRLLDVDRDAGLVVPHARSAQRRLLRGAAEQGREADRGRMGPGEG